MIHVLIDTNIFNKNPKLDNAGFTTLQRLGKEKIIKLHVPYIVKNEYLTKRKLDITSPFLEISKNFDKIIRRALDENDKEKILGYKDHINKIKIKQEKIIENDFCNWLGTQNAETLDIKSTHGKKVMDSYFSGLAPFKSIKNRNDIPDAFIWQNILDLIKEYSQLYVIVKDGKLFETCQNNKNIIPFKTLEEFIESEYLIKEITDKFFVQYFSEFIKKLENYTSYLEEQVNSILVDALVFQEVESPQIPDDNNEAKILSVGKANNIEFNIKNAKYYGDGLILFPFHLDVECTLFYYVFKSDYYSMSEERSSNISVSEYGNKHYLDAEQEFELSVSGHISIEINFSSIDEIKKKIDSFDEILSQSVIAIDNLAQIEVIEDDYYDGYDYL